MHSELESELVGTQQSSLIKLLDFSVGLLDQTAFISQMNKLLEILDDTVGHGHFTFRENYNPVLQDQFSINVQESTLGYVVFLSEFHTNLSNKETQLIEKLLHFVTGIVEKNINSNAFNQSNAHLLHAARATNLGAWEWDLHTNAIKWTDNVESICGMAQGSFDGSFTAYLKIIYPEDLEHVQNTIQQTLESSEDTYFVEHRIIWNDGSVHWIQGRGEVVRNANGVPIILRGTVQDVTKEKSIQKELQDYRQQLERMVEDRAREVRQQAQIINQINDPVVVIGLDGCIKSWNDAASKKLKCDFDSCSGKNITEFQAGDDKIQFSELHKNQSMEIETKLRDFTDAEFAAQLSFSVLKNIENIQDGFVIYIKDISNRIQMENQLRKSESNWRSLTESSPDHIMMLDIDLKIQFVNKASPGLTVAQLIGTSIGDYLSDDIREYVLSVLNEVLATGKSDSYETYFETPEGKVIFYETFVVAKYLDNAIVGLITSSRNITKRKQAEFELEIQNQNLEIANKELEAFSYSTSHDLRAPLRSITSFSELLIDEYQDVLDQQGKDYLSRIRNNALRMSDLLDGMLQLSRLTRSEFNPMTVSLSSLMSECYTRQKHYHARENSQLNLEQDIYVQADINLLRIAVDNMIDNAFKYSSTREVSIVSFGRMRKKGRSVYYVKDNGIGFDIRYIDDLFKPFHRLHNDTKIPGTGIGLATAARAIQRHGGEIWAESELDKGATFYFTLAS